MDKYMSIDRRMIYTKNFKNKKYDQYLYHTLAEKIQYKQKYLQHICINGNQWIVLPFVDSYASHYKWIIFDSNKSNKILDHETFEKLQSFLPSCSLTCIYVVATT